MILLVTLGKGQGVCTGMFFRLHCSQLFFVISLPYLALRTEGGSGSHRGKVNLSEKVIWQCKVASHAHLALSVCKLMFFISASMFCFLIDFDLGQGKGVVYTGK